MENIISELLAAYDPASKRFRDSQVSGDTNEFRRGVMYKMQDLSRELEQAIYYWLLELDESESPAEVDIQELASTIAETRYFMDVDMCAWLAGVPGAFGYCDDAIRAGNCDDFESIVWAGIGEWLEEVGNALIEAMHEARP